MEYYLLKSGICLCVLYGFYKIVLERESMHTTKRLYLLGGLLAGLLIPLVTFTKYVAPQANTVMITTGHGTSANTIEPFTTTMLPIILWSIYLAGVLFFAGRFAINIARIIKRIHQNPHIKDHNYLYVLLMNAVVPHTFFSYIFLNKKHYKNAAIPPEVIAHEKAHAKQKHSIDILVIELVQIVFWFHPLVYKIKSSIKLNHEFLADKAVLDAGFKTTDYQNILLSYAARNQTPVLANAIHYSSIKKRFTVMKTKTSNKTIWFKSLLLLPLGVALLYGFSTVKEVPIEDLSTLDYSIETTADLETSTFDFAEDASLITPDNEVVQTGKPIKITINGKTITVNGKATKLNKFVQAVDNVTKNWNKQDFANTDIIIQMGEVDKKFLNKLNDAYKKTELFMANPNDYGLLPPPPPPPPAPNSKNVVIDRIENNTVKRNKDGNVFVIKETDGSEEQEIEIIEVKNNQSDKQNVWVVKDVSEEIEVETTGGNTFVYRTKPGQELEVIEEVEVIEEIEDGEEVEFQEIEIVNSTQRKGSLKVGNKNIYFKTNNNITTYYDKSGNLVDNTGNLLPPPPPPPPAPEDPLDHIISMAKKGATFTYEGDSISSDKAIELIKKNKKLNILTRLNGGKNPTVKLSKKGIKI